MGRTLRTVALMAYAPPLLLYAAAHLTGLLQDAAAYAVLLLVYAVGMAALFTSRWPRHILLGIGVAYTIASVLLLPFLALLAVCTTGDCP